MKVILVRHGDADAEIPEGLGDEGRSLTAKGRHAVAAHFASLGQRIGTPDLILTSPLVRCSQTATLLADRLNFEGSLKAHRCLLPDGPVGAIDTVIHEHPGDTLVLVGHQPSVGSLAAHLLGLQSFPKPVPPGTVIAVERITSQGATPTHRLMFYCPPGSSPLEQL